MTSSNQIRLPKQPMIIFMSGDKAIVAREETRQGKNGKDESILYMRLPDSVIARYNISESELDFSMHESGIWKNVYPKSSIIKLSDNPEDPIWLCTMNFRGTIDASVSISSEKLKVIMDMQEQIRSLSEDKKRLILENERLRADMSKIVENLVKFKSRLVPLFKDKDNSEIIRLFTEMLLDRKIRQ